jgi:hypothetical protein
VRFLFIKQSTFGLEKKITITSTKKNEKYLKNTLLKKIKKNIGLFRRNLFKNKIKIGNYAGWLNLPVYVKKIKSIFLEKLVLKSI